jgi:hypothetical protein
MYEVENVGIVGLDNAVFLMCLEMDKIDMLRVGEIEPVVRFHTGGGNTIASVRRIK